MRLDAWLNITRGPAPVNHFHSGQSGLCTQLLANKFSGWRHFFTLYQWLLEPVWTARECLLIQRSHDWTPLLCWEAARSAWSGADVYLALSHLRSSPSYWAGILRGPHWENKTSTQSPDQVCTAVIRIDNSQENPFFFLPLSLSLSSCGAPAALEMWTGLQFPKDFSPSHP